MCVITRNGQHSLRTPCFAHKRCPSGRNWFASKGFIAMTHIRSLVLFSISVATLFVGCKDDVVSVDHRPAGLYAKVVNAGGSAVHGVNVHYLFYTTTNPVVTSLWLRYGLSTPQVVTLKVFDPFNTEIATLVNGQPQPAGQHSIYFDSSVTNGIYSYKVQTTDSLQIGSFFIRDDDAFQLQQKPPLVVSDQNGQFFLSPSVLGIGRSFHGDLSTETISDSIAIVLVKANYRTLIQSFRLDTSSPTDKTFTLEPN